MGSGLALKLLVSLTGMFIGAVVAEACWRVLSFLFADYSVTGVTAEVDTRNTASIRLLERLGFERVGFQAGADCFKGASSDEYTYHLSDSAWS